MTEKFMGSSIVSFSESLGWGSQQSQLDVTLADCVSDGDAFSDPVIGSPTTFSFNSHTFNGIVDKYSRSESQSGAPIYNVNLTSGSELLDGVQIIIDDYYGVVQSIPNLINVFGYLENTGGFGASNINDAGMSWDDIASTLDTIINSTGNAYGGPIQYKGYSYGIDLSELPAIPSYYRISGDNISLLSFISEICEAGGSEFFVRLEPYVGGLPLDGVFTIKTISRTSEPSIGAITSYINGAGGCITSKEVGVESRIETTSKFILGANVEDIYFNWPQFTGVNDDTPVEYEDNTIMPFFGFDLNGNAILGSGNVYGDDYYFDILIPDMNFIPSTTFGGGGSTLPLLYRTSTGEVAAAKKSRETWEKFLAIRNFNEYVVDPNGSGTSFFIKDPAATNDYHKYWIKFGYWFLVNKQGFATADAAYTGSTPFVQYTHNFRVNPYYQRASLLEAVQPFAYTYMSTFENDMSTRSPDAYLEYKESFVARMVSFDTGLQNLSNAFSEKTPFATTSNLAIDRLKELYNRVQHLGNEYYNRKYMVRIPFTLAAIEPESYQIRLSQEPINEGYLDEEYWPYAYASGFIPDYSGINSFTTAENKFYPYVKYGDAITKDSSARVIVDSKYDFSDVPDDAKVYHIKPSGSIISGDTYEGYLIDVFIKCDVDDKIVFVDQSILYSPRAVITLPGPVKPVNDFTKSDTAKGDLRRLITDATAPDRVFAGDATVDDTFIKRRLSAIGVDAIDLEVHEGICFADVYAVPLKNNLLCYGPWWAIGAAGKVEYERNTELNPWNYDGFTNMNVAGLSRANDSLTNQTFAEAGSLTFAGSPTATLGAQLIAGGPYITNINVNFSDGGTTSQYQFQTWSSHRRFSKLNLYNTNRIERLAKTSRELRRNFRDQFPRNKWRLNSQLNTRMGQAFFNQFLGYPRRLKNNTSHHVLAGQNHQYSSTVVSQPFYNTQGSAYDDWENKAFMSLDGLFRPYSTVEHSGGMNYFGVPDINKGYSPSVEDLNPLDSGHDISMLSMGTTPPSGGLDSIQTFNPELDENDVLVARGLGFKLPMVGVGYSYDLNGYCVQYSGDDKRVWAPDYNWNHEDWKTGPFDWRWDSDLGIYCGVKALMGVAKEDIPTCSDVLTPSSGLVSRFTPGKNQNATGGDLMSDAVCFVFDSSLGDIQRGTFVMYYNIDGFNTIFYASCNVDPVASGLLG